MLLLSWILGDLVVLHWFDLIVLLLFWGYSFDLGFYWIEDLGVMENQFHIKVNVGKYVCLVRIDSFCTNLISEYAVTQLGLKVENHPYPYKLNYCNKEFWVTKQAWVAISSGSFKDTVLVMLCLWMIHISLGESWKYLNKAVYDPIRDIYRIYSGRKLVLSPLSKK